MAPLPVSGIIEGFYGRPWTWAERGAAATACASWGMTDYVYAPKDDPKHREAWRDPYTDAELAEFADHVESSPLRFGFGISPGLSIDADDDGHRKALLAKIDQVVEVGADLVALCLDDIPFGGGPQGRAHGELTTWLVEHLGDRADVVVVPTEYVGIHATPYLRALGAATPSQVAIAWTGDAVVNDAITTMQAERRAEALGGRPPLLWDNVPVNDALMADRLHLGPMWGRDAELPDHLAGYLANPMVQPTATLLPLASIGAWLRGEDPLDAWAAEADRRGWRVFAEACDGAVPHALVAMAADTFATGHLRVEDLDPLRDWFDAAADVTAPGLEDECAGWLAQTRAEAGVAVAALDLLRAAIEEEPPAGEDLVGPAFVLGFRWRALLATTVSVMGPRLGFRPVLGQAADGSFAFRRSSIVEDANAVDGLCRLALDAVAWAAERG